MSGVENAATDLGLDSERVKYNLPPPDKNRNRKEVENHWLKLHNFMKYI